MPCHMCVCVCVLDAVDLTYKTGEGAGHSEGAAFNRITNVKLLCQLASLFEVMCARVCVCVTLTMSAPCYVFI